MVFNEKAECDLYIKAHSWHYEYASLINKCLLIGLRWATGHFLSSCAGYVKGYVIDI